MTVSLAEWLPHSDTITANSEPRTVSLALWLLMNHRETLQEMITIITIPANKRGRGRRITKERKGEGNRVGEEGEG